MNSALQYMNRITITSCLLLANQYIRPKCSLQQVSKHVVHVT